MSSGDKRPSASLLFLPRATAIACKERLTAERFGLAHDCKDAGDRAVHGVAAERQSLINRGALKAHPSAGRATISLKLQLQKKRWRTQVHHRFFNKALAVFARYFFAGIFYAIAYFIRRIFHGVFGALCRVIYFFTKLFGRAIVGITRH